MESLCVRHINPTDLQYRMSGSLYLRKLGKKWNSCPIWSNFCVPRDIFLLVQFNERQHDKWDDGPLVQCLLWTIWIQINVKSIQQWLSLIYWWYNEPGPDTGNSLLSVSVDTSQPIIGDKWTGDPGLRNWDTSIVSCLVTTSPVCEPRGGYGDTGSARLTLAFMHNTENVIGRNYPRTIQIQTKHKGETYFHFSVA